MPFSFRNGCRDIPFGTDHLGDKAALGTRIALAIVGNTVGSGKKLSVTETAVDSGLAATHSLENP
jgi:hypothetical protein